MDAKKVGIEGVSRYGKAALVTMAYDTRFAVVLVGSSGEGGAKPHRRNFGEAVENLTGSGEYHWMAGNFLKYGAAEATFGSKTAGDIPVDSHQLIALCAPRATFISYGIPEKGDAKWLDQQGSYMATIAAGAVFRLLGAKDLGRGDDYRTAKMPPVNEGLLDGHLAWRQHDGGHTDGPNWKYFIPWADRLLRRHTARGRAVEASAGVRLQEPNDHERAIVLRGARFREARHLRHDLLADSLGRARRALRGDREDAVVSELLFLLVFGLVDAIRVDNQRVAGRDLLLPQRYWRWAGPPAPGRPHPDDPVRFPEPKSPAAAAGPRARRSRSTMSLSPDRTRPRTGSRIVRTRSSRTACG